MATHNIVPNADNEGLLGTPAKRWAGGNFAQTLKKGGLEVVTEAPQDGKTYSRLNGAWTQSAANTYQLAASTVNGTTVVAVSYPGLPVPAFIEGEIRQFEIRLAGFNKTDDTPGSWYITGTVQKRLAGPMVMLGTPQVTVSGSPWATSSLVKVTINQYTSNIDVSVMGVAGKAIDWTGTFTVLNKDIVQPLTPIYGCTDAASPSYNSAATVEDLSGVYPRLPGTAMLVPVLANNTITSLNVTATNGGVMTPAFDPAIHDYYIHTTSTEWANVDYSITINEDSPVTGSTLVNKALQISDGDNTYYVRFTPVDLVQASVVLPPTSAWKPGYYTLANTTPATAPATSTLTSKYYYIFNKDCVPIWYFQAADQANHLMMGKEPNKVVAACVAGTSPRNLVKINSRALQIEAVTEKTPTFGGTTPAWARHEAIEIKAPFSRYGNVLSTSANYGTYIQEQNANREVIWEWRLSDYISGIGAFTSGTFHVNSIDIHPITGDLLISFRNNSCVIAVDYRTKDVLWVIQGNCSPTNFTFQSKAIPEKTVNTKWLTILNEPIYLDYQYNGPCAQHHARWHPEIPPLSSGNIVISMFDNQSTSQAGVTSNVFVNSAPRSRGVVYEINPTAGTCSHRSSIFCETGNGTAGGPSGLGTGKSSYLGSYTIIDDGDGSYTHTINFPEQHPCLYEYRGTIDGEKTKVFCFDMPGDQFRIIKYPIDKIRLDNMRATCGMPLNGVIPGASSYSAGTGLIPSNCQAFYDLENTSPKIGNAAFTNNGGVTFGAGKVGNAAVFGGNNWLSLSSQPGYPYAYITISLWLKTTGTGEMTIISSSGTTYSKGYELKLNNGNLIFTTYFGASSDFQTLTSNRTVNNGSWHHIVAIYTSSGEYESAYLKLYIDNISDNTYAHGDQRPIDGAVDGTTVIGANIDGSGSFFTGTIDSVGIWNKTLEVSDVAQLYNAGIGLEPV